MEDLKNTHVNLDDTFKYPTHTSINTLGDNIGSVEKYDFSKANLCYENRVAAISLVASICYQNPKAIGSISLFNRLACEASSLPSSAYEFVPVLLDPNREPDTLLLSGDNNVKKYGEWVEATNDSGNLQRFLLTNYRALVFDYDAKLAEMNAYALDLGKTNEWVQNEEEIIKTNYLEFYNNEFECNIIKEHFKVFKFKVDLSTRSQMVRHRVNWQELSRRYVSGKRVPFDFFISEPMSKIELDAGYRNEDGKSITFDMEDLCNLCVDFYNKAIDAGIKPQEARRVIPQAMYTNIWGAFQPKQLENFYNLRLDDAHAQREINLIAKAMKGFE